MSDLTATNCGCGCENGGSPAGTSIFGGGSDCGCSILWILLLLSLCNNGTSFANSNGCDGGSSCWLIILLLLFCNGGCGCGGNY